MKWLVNEAVKRYLQMRMKRIEQYMVRPEESQERWLRKILDRGRTTEFGKRYDLLGATSIEAFKSKVPVHEYDDLKDDIRRMMLGEKNVLWPGEVNWYSKSSGTTSDKSKFIPVPYGNLFNCHLAGVWDSMALLYANKPEMLAFQHKNLVVPGSFYNLEEYPKTHVGDVSAILVQHMPTIGRVFYTPDIQTVLQPNFEEKLHHIAEITSKQQDIVTFGGVPTWLIVLFRLLIHMEKRAKAICWKYGRICRLICLEASVLNLTGKHLKPWSQAMILLIWKCTMPQRVFWCSVRFEAKRYVAVCRQWCFLRICTR
ncbi:MAG: GH3 auxin-responsive promoter family protein [Saprospiraceae bacterium]